MDRKIRIGIKESREKIGLSQTELAAKLKVEITVLKGWEAGAAFPTLEILILLSKILNVSTEMLMFSENRDPLDISELNDENKAYIIDFYKKITKNT